MEFITYEVEGQIGIITINRPKALNALNSAVLDELDKTLDAVDQEAIRCLILTGAGEKSFVAGADIGEMSTLTKAEGEALFGQPEVGLGITPGFGGTQRLARIVGTGKAKEMIYGARNIKAEEAYRIGLVNNVYPAEELMPAAKKLASTIARNAPIAVRNCKRAINEGIQVDMDQAIVIEEKLFGSCFETCDQKEGMNAFLEKRKVDAFLNK